MLRTNCKAVKEKIKNYIIEGFLDSSWCSDLGIDETATYKDICDGVLTAFYEEIIKHDSGYYTNIKSKYNLYDGFVYWCGGLCSAIDTAYYSSPIAKDIVAEWLEETDEEKSKFTEEQAEQLITKLLWRELIKNANINPCEWVRWR